MGGTWASQYNILHEPFHLQISLFVSMCVRSMKVVLNSTTGNKELVPQLSCTIGYVSCGKGSAALVKTLEPVPDTQHSKQEDIRQLFQGSY